jgi:hypothetical protein
MTRGKQGDLTPYLCKCGQGAFTAGLGTFASSHAIDFGDNQVLGTLQAAFIGGTMSVIGGGKFANGAQTGAFQYLFNACASGQCGSTPEESQGPTLGDVDVDRRLLIPLGALLAAPVAGAGYGYAALVLEARALGVTVEYLSKVRAGMLAEPTGRTVAANAAEALAMREAAAGAGRVAIPAGKVSDPRLQGAAWEKIHHSATVDGIKGVVHYLREKVTGIVQDFKFK